MKSFKSSYSPNQSNYSSSFSHNTSKKKFVLLVAVKTVDMRDLTLRWAWDDVHLQMSPHQLVSWNPSSPTHIHINEYTGRLGTAAQTDICKMHWLGQSKESWLESVEDYTGYRGKCVQKAQRPNPCNLSCFFVIIYLCFCRCVCVF